MKLIKNEEVIQGKNSDVCLVKEYSFDDEDLDLGVATITGRYPEKGYCLNEECKELIYVLEGNGTLYFENRKVEYSKGDSILIMPKEKYYWESNYCMVSMICNPSWSSKQHKLSD